jgi:hypothetical protein
METVTLIIEGGPYDEEGIFKGHLRFGSTVDNVTYFVPIHVVKGMTNTDVADVIRDTAMHLPFKATLTPVFYGAEIITEPGNKLQEVHLPDCFEIEWIFNTEDEVTPVQTCISCSEYNLLNQWCKHDDGPKEPGHQCQIGKFVNS